mgnify:CR=1 FL=1
MLNVLIIFIAFGMTTIGMATNPVLTVSIWVLLILAILFPVWVFSIILAVVAAIGFLIVRA